MALRCSVLGALEETMLIKHNVKSQHCPFSEAPHPGPAVAAACAISVVPSPVLQLQN